MTDLGLCIRTFAYSSILHSFLFQQFVDFLAEVGVVFLQPSGDKRLGVWELR